MFEYLDLDIPIKEAANARTFPGGRARGHISFEGVTFTYPSARKATIEDVSFEVPCGAHIALVGSTGSGKTTLGYLLSRLYDVSEGRIRIDGIDVRELKLDALAGAVGVVTQETYLLHASIAENLRFVKPETSEADMIAACEIAQIHAHIESLPNGYDTVVGERGYRFSGGEKQRLAIARTVLRDPPILVLDEATSALDTVTERAMGGALRSLSEGRTTISIAHRLSTVRDADQILVVKSGRICERGTYDELLAAGGEFSRLATGEHRS